MIDTLADIFGSLFTRKTVLIWALCAFIAAAAGPFGTYELQSFGIGLVFWSLVIVVSSIIGQGCHCAIRINISPDRPILSDLAMVVMMTVLFTPFLWLLTNHVFLSGQSPGPGLMRLGGYVAIITVAICVARRILPGFEPVGYFGTEPASEQVEPRLQRRLPPCYAGPILRLAGRDHFVDVVTETQTYSIRLRFSDAIQEMDAVPGHCTHRSHWVVEDAIMGVEREGGRIQLKLVNGDLVPVSRKYKPALEEAGLI